MKLFLPTIFILSSFIAISLATETKLECTFSNVLFLYFSWTPTCTVRTNPNIINDNTTITSINDVQPNTKTSFLYVFGRTVYYIPKGLDVVFSNLTGMRFELTKLKHITKENLRPFPQLLMFASVGNQVQFVEQDLFMYNPLLEYVSLRANRITYIDPNVFEVVRGTLKNLYLDGTALACGFVGAITPNAVGRVIDRIINTECGKIENAPPLYEFWLKSQGAGCNDIIAAKEECEKKSAEKDDIMKILAEGCPSAKSIISDYYSRRP